MAMLQTILALITDNAGNATKDFLMKTSSQWADEQMLLRYSQAKHPDDTEDSFPFACWDQLRAEYDALRSWFDQDGKLNLLLQSASLVKRMSGPIDDGVGWDWKQNGDPEHQMRMFKGMVIAIHRAMSLIPRQDRNNGNKQMGGLATLIVSAYNSRAALHRWNGASGKGTDQPNASGVIMSRRWVAHMSYTLLVQLGAIRKWSWEVSKCKNVFGVIEEEKSIN